MLAVLASRYAVDLSERLSWRRLLAAVFAAGLAWMLALAFVDGAHGIGHILETPYEYLRTARKVADVHQLLQEYVSRIAVRPARRTGRCTSRATRRARCSSSSAWTASASAAASPPGWS